MNKFIITYEHRHGVDVFVIETNCTQKELQENLHALCDMLETDYEPDRGETIEFETLKKGSYKKINRADLLKPRTNENEKV